MPAPHKGYKTIDHHDTQYRWILRNTRGVNELVIEASESVHGQMLIAELPRIVNWDMVTDAIDFAIAQGWTPHSQAPPFRCTYARRAFQRVP